MMALSKARFGDDPSCRAGFLRHRRRVWTQGPSVWRAFALAVATKEATDKDSNVLHGRTAHESAVAIRKPADAGNGYRFAKFLHPMQRTRILSSRLCSSQLNPRPGNSPSSLSFEKMHAGWRKPPCLCGPKGFYFSRLPQTRTPRRRFCISPLRLETMKVVSQSSPLRNSAIIQP